MNTVHAPCEIQSKGPKPRCYLNFIRRVVRVVEGAALEMLCTKVPRVRIPNSPPKASRLTCFFHFSLWLFNCEMKRISDTGTLGKILYAEGEYNHPADAWDTNFTKIYKFYPNHWRHFLPATYYITQCRQGGEHHDPQRRRLGFPSNGVRLLWGTPQRLPPLRNQGTD